jgi:hypothetical protein
MRHESYGRRTTGVAMCVASITLNLHLHLHLHLTDSCIAIDSKRADKNSIRIRCSHIGCYEEYYLLRYNAE